MEIIEFEYPNIPTCLEKTVLCLGYFDGIHLGHKALISDAKKEGYKVGVLTYDNPPSVVLNKIHENISLSSIADKAEFLEDLGVDYLYLMHFDMTVAMLSKDEFIEEVLKVLNPVKLYCGEDHKFGMFAEGNPTYLSKFFDICIHKLESDNGNKISTRDICKLIEDGNVEEANRLLGRPYRINGLVVEGLHNGKNLEFPTANLKLDYSYVFPKDAVYYGYASVYDHKYKAIISVGTHPTIMPLPRPIIEVHILDYEGNLYGKDIFVEFVINARENHRFGSMDELKAQLQKDKTKAKKLLPDIE